MVLPHSFPNERAAAAQGSGQCMAAGTGASCPPAGTCAKYVSVIPARPGGAGEGAGWAAGRAMAAQSWEEVAPDTRDPGLGTPLLMGPPIAESAPAAGEGSSRRERARRHVGPSGRCHSG